MESFEIHLGPHEKYKDTNLIELVYVIPTGALSNEGFDLEVMKQYFRHVDIQYLRERKPNVFNTMFAPPEYWPVHAKRYTFVLNRDLSDYILKRYKDKFRPHTLEQGQNQLPPISE